MLMYILIEILQQACGVALGLWLFLACQNLFEIIMDKIRGV